MRLIREHLTDNSRAALYQLDNGKYQVFVDDNGIVKKIEDDWYLKALARYYFFENTIKEQTK